MQDCCMFLTFQDLPQKKKKIFFELDENRKTTIEELVEKYVEYIISGCK